MALAHKALRAVYAARPPEITGIGGGAGWQFEMKALADDFRHFEVTALASDTPTISIFDYIGDDGEGGGVNTKRIAAALRSIGDKPVNVEMNSPGGNYFEGVAIYNLLRRHPHAVHVQILGIAASAASVIAMAGDTIAIAHNAEIMIHEATGVFIGTKSEMAEAVETLQHIDDSMVATYAARSGRPAEEFAAMIAGKDVFFRGQEAIDAGLADTLMEREAQMPVYASTDDFPSDKPSLDRFLAKQNMPRSARRDLFRAIGTPSAADPATPRAGDEPKPDLSRLLTALTVWKETDMTKMTTLRGTAATGRGLVAVRAEAQPKKPVSIDDLGVAFEAFKAAHTAQIEDIKAGKTDVVTTEKVDRINEAVGTMQATIDDLSRVQAAMKLGEGGTSAQPRDPEYTKEFDAYFKRGVTTAKLEELRAAATKTDSEGGYLAPVEWDRTISTKLKQVSMIRQYASVIQISGAGFKKVFSDRVVGSGWVGETAARPATTTPGLTSLDFPLGELYANPAASQGLIDDAEVDIEAWLAEEVSVEFDKQEGIAFLSGDGTNKPYGILTYVTGAANAARHPWGAIPVVNTGSAAALTGDGFLDLIGALPAEFTANARLFINRQTAFGARKLKDGQGNYLWQPSFAMGQPASLAGEPVVDVPAMPGVGAGNIAALFGDMAETYQVVDRIGTRVLRDPFTNKPFVHFYTTKRVGGGVKNPEAMRALKVSA